MQPYLHDLIIIVRAPAMAVSGRDGQVRPSGAQGWYVNDRRVLSELVLTLDGVEPEPVGGRFVGASTARFASVAAMPGEAGHDPTVFVERERAVADGMIRETITVTSRARQAVRTVVGLRLSCDLAEIAAVRGAAPSEPPDTGTLCWPVELRPGGSWSVGLEVGLDDPEPPVLVPATYRLPGPTVHSGDQRFAALVEQGVADLDALLAADPAQPANHVATAGAPWYLALFGRDSIWAARMALPLGTELAAGTLRALARRQGRRHNPETAEEPGKILHELRRAEAQHAGSLRLPPCYYGTVDATPLWISLLHDAWRWGMPPGGVEELLPALEAALRWVRTATADGFLRYVDTTGHGLANQGWKDSPDAVQFRDGALARPPIALAEVQGYAHRAALDGAALLDAFGRPGAEQWRVYAAELAERFRAHFWVDGAYPAIALDGDDRPVDTLTSNIGHLLGSGLLDERETALVVDALRSPDLDCGFGLRTLAGSALGFNPLSYHCGSVWPHDTAIVVSGLGGAGTSLIHGLLRAATAFDYRLPELFGGESGPFPLAYPTACHPQAWSAAAAIALLTAILGVQPDVPYGTVRFAPLRPSPVGELTVRGLRVAGEPLDVHLSADGTLDVLAAPASLTISVASS